MNHVNASVHYVIHTSILRRWALLYNQNENGIFAGGGSPMTLSC